MFSLIITIISIALVAALALATLYYGGAAFERGAASADATKLYTQSQQLQGAAELYKADTGAYPLTLAALVSADYLKSIPVSRLLPDVAPSVLTQAMAAGTPWKMVLSGYPVFAVESVTPAVCEAVNLKAYGTSGILKSARSQYATQCFGPDLTHLTMVTSKSADALLTAAASGLATVALGTVLTTAPPAVGSGDTTAAGWLTVEGVTVAAVSPPGPAPSANPVITVQVDLALGYDEMRAGPALTYLFSNIKGGSYEDMQVERDPWESEHSLLYRTSDNNYGDCYQSGDAVQSAVVGVWNSNYANWTPPPEGSTNAATYLSFAGTHYCTGLVHVELPPSSPTGGTWCITLTKDLAAIPQDWVDQFAEAAQAVRKWPWSATAELGACAL